MNRDLIASIIFSLVCFLFFTFVVPQYQAILDVRAAIDDRQSLLNERTGLKKNVEELAAQYEERKVEIQKLDRLLPKGSKYDEIIENIYNIAAQSGLQVSSLTMNEETKTNTNEYSRVFIRLETSSSYEALSVLLGELEKSLRLYDISEINLGRGAVATGSTTPGDSFAVDIRFNTYSLK